MLNHFEFHSEISDKYKMALNFKHYCDVINWLPSRNIDLTVMTIYLPRLPLNVIQRIYVPNYFNSFLSIVRIVHHRNYQISIKLLNYIIFTTQHCMILKLCIIQHSLVMKIFGFLSHPIWIKEGVYMLYVLLMKY